MTTLVDPTFTVLGVKVHAVQIPDAIARIENWVRERDGGRYVCVTGMHGIMEAQHDAKFSEILRSADLVVPDGMPLVWLGRTQGHQLRRRVYGPELMEAFCARTGATYRHFFYGGRPGVANLLARTMSRAHGITVAGIFSPPFRPLSIEERSAMIEQISSTRPDVLWVGLSTPKQERWMYEHTRLLRVPVMIGVGAAFDFHTGQVQQAPVWMREHGLEWAFRLIQEPRRLWRRYLIYGSEFVFRLMLVRIRNGQFG